MNFLDGRVEQADGRLTLVLAGNVGSPDSRSLPRMFEPMPASRSRLACGRSTCGCRPRPVEYPVPSTQCPVVYFGGDRGYRAAGGGVARLSKERGTRFIVGTEGDIRLSIGDPVLAAAQPEHLHFFDAASEARFNWHARVRNPRLRVAWA